MCLNGSQCFYSIHDVLLLYIKVGGWKVKVKYSGLAVFPLTLTGHNFFIKNNFLVLFEDLKRA